MRILFLDAGYDTQAQSLGALQAQGHEVTVLDIRPYLNQTKRGGELLDILLTQGREQDFILTMNGLGFDEKGQIPKALSEAGLHFASWEIDHPHFLSHFGLRAIPTGDYFTLFLWDEGYLADMHKRGVEHVYYLPNGTDPKDFTVHKAHKRYRCLQQQVTFVGTSLTDFIETFVPQYQSCDFYGKDRQAVVSALCQALASGKIKTIAALRETVALPHCAFQDDAEASQFWALAELVLGQYYRTHMLGQLPKVRVYGEPAWLATIAQARFGGHVDYHKALKHIYHNSFINLNLTLAKNRWDANQRIFDVPLADGFLITDNKRNIARHFKVGEEIIVFEDLADLKDKIRFYQAKPAQRDKVIAKAKQRILAEHTYAHRLQNLSAIMQERVG